MITSVKRKKLPRVVIAGRPNVGKSTLFNRLVGQRKAITDPTPGVTRDAIESECVMNGEKVCLIDTGGYKAEQEVLDDLVAKRSIEMVKEADLVLLVLDSMEVTPEDEHFIDLLRPYTSKILLVVNKIDTELRDDLLWNFYSYGFEDIIGISASHGRNCDELIDKITGRIDFENLEDEEEDDVDIRIAILGKPNTGKSTLLNHLTDTESSIVSDIPGTTRDVVEGKFQFQDTRFKVLDTAGIRRKKKVNEDIEYYSVNRAIKSIEDADIVFLMIDSLEGLAEQDKKIAALIVNKLKGVVIVLNKWDEMADIPNQFEAVSDRVRFMFPVLEFAPIIPISAKEGTGMKKLLTTAVKQFKQLQIRIETNDLNRYVKEWIERQPIPHDKKHRPYKIRYATQVSSHPVRFVFFMNNTKSFPGSYVGYLRNRIRQELGFSIVPFDIELRASKRKDYS